MDNERIRFPRGGQKRFLDQAIARASGVDKLAQFLSVSSRTVRDWRREKFLMAYEAASITALMYELEMPDGVRRETAYWNVSNAGRTGGPASYKKQKGIIGDPLLRKQRWHEWWELNKHRSHFPCHQLPFHEPDLSVLLAEFIGIMMGDGGMTARQFTISLHHIDDLAYSKFVTALIEQLFHIAPSIRHIPKNSVNIIVVSRTKLMHYLHGLGLPLGNKVKQNFTIPQWIQENEEFMAGCVRGLVDTDGSIFNHEYASNGKQYSYKKLSFSSASLPLREVVQLFLENHGFHARFTRGIEIRLESKKDMEHYMKFIGSHNPKHLNRYYN